MAVDDLMINVYLKRILNRNHIDTQELKFWATNQVVYLVGVLQTAEGRLVSKMELSTLENEIRRVPGVKGISFKIKHWRKRNNEWTEVGSD